jgi:lipopolysaccharide/colanic/teichoic acid biosynthesis glycosyltransferase
MSGATMPASTLRPDARPRPPGDGHGQGRPYLIDEEPFRHIVTRERRRAERSGVPLVLLVVRLPHGRRAAGPALRRAAMAAVSAAKRETDIAGWLERARVLGVVLTQIREADVAAACDAVQTRVRRELEARIDADTLRTLAIHLDVSPGRDRSHQRRRAGYHAMKRALDIVGSLTLLIALVPLMLLIALLVKSRSRGPVLFRQVRIGQGLQPFTMLKFRTMAVNADHAVHHQFVTAFINARAPLAAPGAPGVFKLTNDPRVTPVGRILRKTSLDELPQLWNVLRGDMSLVGPRPALAYELEQYQPWHRRRLLEAKPGITGLWQVVGRSRTTFDDMVRMDLRYVQRRSLWTDVTILLATPKAVILGRGAC